MCRLLLISDLSFSGQASESEHKEAFQNPSFSDLLGSVRRILGRTQVVACPCTENSTVAHCVEDLKPTTSHQRFRVYSLGLYSGDGSQGLAF